MSHAIKSLVKLLLLLFAFTDTKLKEIIKKKILDFNDDNPEKILVSVDDD